MYGFVFWKCNHNENEKKFADSFITSHKKINPFMELDQQYHYRKIKNYNLLHFKPENEEAIALIQQYESEKYFILFWGQLFSATENCAQYIFNQLEKGKSIENLNGNYSFILYYKDSDSIRIYSDFIGRRKLYYYHDTAEFAVSNLDHMLVPFLPKPIQYDQVSVASSVYFEWSITGKSFLRLVENTSPDAFLFYEKNRIKLMKISYNLDKENIKTTDVINDYLSYLENSIKDKEIVHIDLTAGLDTRTVLALLLKNFKKHIVTWTFGIEGMDFKTASKIAKRFKLTHKSSSTTFSSSFDFVRQSIYFAFCNNGDENSIRAIDKITIDNKANIPKIIGLYGTISSGKNIVGNIHFNVYKEKMFANKLKITFLSVELLSLLKTRLFKYLNILKSNYIDKYQELYYIRERCGNWGSIVFNSTWNMKHLCPFEDISAIQNILSLPTDIRRKGQIQHDILLDYSKYLYLYPINQNPFNNGYFLFIPEKYRLFFRKAWNFLLRKKGKLLNKTVQDISQQRSDIFFEYFKQDIKPLLIRADALNTIIMTSNDREKLINSFENNKIGIHQISQLFTMELWKDIIDQISIIKRDT